MHNFVTYLLYYSGDSVAVVPTVLPLPRFTSYSVPWVRRPRDAACDVTVKAHHYLTTFYADITKLQ